MYRKTVHRVGHHMINFTENKREIGMRRLPEIFEHDFEEVSIVDHPMEENQVRNRIETLKALKLELKRT